jgi:hypothetical protein
MAEKARQDMVNIHIYWLGKKEQPKKFDDSTSMRYGQSSDIFSVGILITFALKYVS